MGRAGIMAGAAWVLVALAGCGGTPVQQAPPAVHPAPVQPGPDQPGSVQTGATRTGTSTPPPPETRWPAYLPTIVPVTARRLGPSWHLGCPTSYDGLRLVRLWYAGFDGRPHEGELIVAEPVAAEVAAIFGELYAARFPIRQVRTVDAYGASDDASVAADNTSAFNCRLITGGTAWSRHAYGRAIDLNPRENPYVTGGTAFPPGSTTDRDPRRAGVVTPAVVRMFARHGWQWGGYWTGPIDYQHFEKR
ncbi:MAG TPA: M15 family metallopeptidase [Mycobacteriales bacterium]|nr:M15 family metallopeptidase [Mycobacteriales bacterium]